MKIQTTIYGEMNEAAKVFATAAKLAEAGHFVNVLTVGGEIVVNTSATEFEYQAASEQG